MPRDPTRGASLPLVPPALALPLPAVADAGRTPTPDRVAGVTSCPKPCPTEVELLELDDPPFPPDVWSLERATAGVAPVVAPAPVAEPLPIDPVVAAGEVAFPVAGAVVTVVGAEAVPPFVPSPEPVAAFPISVLELALPPVELALFEESVRSSEVPPTFGEVAALTPPALVPVLAGVRVADPTFAPDAFAGLIVVPRPLPICVELDELELFPPLAELSSLVLLTAGVWPTLAPLEVIEPVLAPPVVAAGVVAFVVAGALERAVGAEAVLPPVPFPFPVPVFADAFVVSELALPPAELALLRALSTAALTPLTDGAVEPLLPPAFAPAVAGLTLEDPTFAPDALAGVTVVPSAGPTEVELLELDDPPLLALELLPEFETGGVWPTAAPDVDRLPVDAEGAVAPGLDADALAGCVDVFVGAHSVPQSADARSENAPSTASAATAAIA